MGILKTKLIAVDTPENLRKSVWGKKTVVQLESINEKIISALKNDNFTNIETINNKILIQVSDAVKENPHIVKTIISAGGKIQFVTEFNPSLDDAYLKLIRN